MTISSRTPEGHPNRCPVCRRRLRLSPSWPSADAPCPHCGSLVWFPDAPGRRRPAQPESSVDFTLDDLRGLFVRMQKMTGMRELMSQMPGGSEADPGGEDPDAARKRVQGIIDAMTKEERRNPELIDVNRRRRIAAGSGTEPDEIEHFLSQFAQARDLMRKMATMSIWQRIQ
jgi:signal recognition particle GTPase